MFANGEGRTNLRNVYREIHRYGPVTKAQLLETLKIKPTTLNRMMDQLIQEHYIQESGHETSSGGRPPVLYAIRRERGFMVGVDISRIRTRLVLSDLSFAVRSRRTFTMTSEHTPKRTVAEIQDHVEAMLEEQEVPREKLLGIGVGTVGPLDVEEGLILRPEGFPAPGWHHVAINKQLKRQFSVPVFLINGAKSALIGEYNQADFMERNVLYCISGEGLRCGVMTNGELVQSKTGDVSSYGHMVIEVDGRRCTCGKRGCLTAYMSFEAIREEWERKRKKHSVPPSAAEIVDSLKKGDTNVREAVMNTAHYYGIGLANMINLMHPEAVILSGTLIDESPAYYEKVIATARNYLYYTEKDQIRFSQGHLKSEAAAVGAAILVYRSL